MAISIIHKLNAYAVKEYFVMFSRTAKTPKIAVNAQVPTVV